MAHRRIRDCRKRRSCAGCSSDKNYRRDAAGDEIEDEAEFPTLRELRSAVKTPPAPIDDTPSLVAPRTSRWHPSSHPNSVKPSRSSHPRTARAGKKMMTASRHFSTAAQRSLPLPRPMIRRASSNGLTRPLRLHVGQSGVDLERSDRASGGSALAVGPGGGRRIYRRHERRVAP